MKRLLFMFLFLCAFTAEDWDDPSQQLRYQKLIQEIRCPTCQNSNIAESDAPLARQLRDLVAEQIRAGESDSAIEAYLLARYGDFISYRPPFRVATLALWLAPAAFMLLLMFWARQKRFRQRQRVPNLQLTLHGALPMWFYAVAAMLMAASIWAWWQQSEAWRRWYRLQQDLEAPVMQALHLQRFPDLSLLEFPPIFCQAMQEALPRQDESALLALGECYQSVEMHEWALQVYRLILQQQPEHPKALAAWVQTDLFSQPEQALKPETETRLKQLIALQPDVLMHRILLAAAYEKSQRAPEALPIWQDLKGKTGDDNLERYIEERMQAAQWRLPIELKLCTSDVPAEALIFVTVSRLSQEKPPLMARVLPILPQQEALFTAADSMMLAGQTLPQQDLRVQAFISADGTVTGQRLAQSSINIQSLQALTLELCP